ncbi:hypothetical protein BDR26DRAFT_906688 [Obelidium mucronatum]|nr:hypothetical protein BDR26DRAFT_906688 [Obelidium mucronatum]
MLEPVIAARNYGYVQIIDRETIDLDDEDRIFKLLKAKYEEAMALAKTDTASLLVINLSDIVGMITKIQQSVRVSTRTEKREETSNVGETSDSKIQSRAVENVKNNSKEQVILNAFESSYRQSLLDSEETLSSYENQLEFSNDLVKNSMEKESSSEKKQEQQEFTSKTTRNRSTKVSENESFLSRLMKKARKENVEQVSTTHVESTNVETVIGRETDKTFRTEITDTESQKITAETSTTNTKSRGTDLKHDNVQSLTQTDTQFTANTSHQKTLTSTNESLTDRDTFREEHLVEKSHIEEKRHEQIKSVEHDVSEGSRFSIVHEEKDEKVTALNRSKITSDTESFKVDDRTFTSQSHSKTISDSERTDTTRTDTTVDEESKNIDDQKQDTTRKTGTTGKEVADILEKTTNDSLSIKGSEGKSHTTDQSTDQGTTTQRKDLKDGSAYSTTTLTAQGGWKNNSLFVDMTASEEIGVKANFTHSNDRTSTTASNLNINDNTTKSSSIDTDKSKATNTAKAESEIKKSDDTTGKSKSDIETGTKRGTTTGSDQITKSKTTSTTIEDKTEEGRSHDETTSRVHEETQRTEEVENTSQSVSDSTRRETYRDTRNTTTDTVRDTNSITDAQTTKDSTSQSKEQIKEITESRYEESQTLEEQGTRSETRRETSDTITKSEYESTMREEKTMQSQSASVEHSNTRTAAESERDFQSHTTTHGTRNEKETRKQEIMGQESAQEQERQKRREVETVENAVKEKEEVLRQLISKDTERLRETSMSEEYRKRLNDVITSRKQLQNQLTKEKEESQKKSQQVTTRNTDGSSTTVGTTSQLNETNTNRDEQSTSFVSDTSNEVEISQQMLRLKIIDVIGRFAGLASEYLNNFDLKRGPDVVFAVDNPLLATVVEKTISWGQLETPCPEDSLSIPQILFSDKYKAAFWLEVIELGLLEHLRIILTPVERGTQIELDCPQFVREKNNKDNESIADRLKSLELFGPLSQNNRPTLKFNDKMFGMIADQDKFCNLTTLTLTGLEVGLTPQRAYMKMTCRTLKSLNLSLCQIGIDGSNDEFASLSYILKLFSGNEYVLDAFPQLIEFALRSPISSLGSDGKPYKPITWVVTDNCIPVMEKLQCLDLTKNHIEAESVQRRLGLECRMMTESALDLEKHCGRLYSMDARWKASWTVSWERDETPKGGSSLDAKEALKLNCYNVQPSWSARTAAFWANQRESARAAACRFCEFDL